MPDDADENNIKAEFRDGMLNVTLAKSAMDKGEAKAINVAVT